MEVSPISASLGAMGSILRKLDELLATGHRALRGAVVDDIEQLTTDLHNLQNLLLKLSNAQDPPMAAGYWMKEVRELSYDMEDCADQFISAHARAKIRRATRGKTIITRLKIKRLPERPKGLPWITSKVSEFRTRALEATQRYWRYKFDDCNSNPVCSHVSRVAYPEEAGNSSHVGMEGPVDELDRWLTDEEEQLKVVAIVGVAGVGKTTLAQKLWGKLQGQFECHAFVRTAQKPNMRGIISSILSQVRPHKPPDPADMHHLICDLREYLQDKKYFVIIDDLWATSVWDVLSRAFPEGKCCSRIITTTEIMEVARACCGYCPDYIFQMEFLSDDDSQKLLLQRILLGNQSPQRFDHVLPHILRKCGGLPLAIIMAASLIASRPEKLDQLGFVQNSFGSNSGVRAHPTIEGFMGQLLNISFDTLPHYLKTCLLYLSTCPEGYIFLKDDLVKQWIAEDFICAHLGGDKEEVARTYFDELVTMGLIQVMGTNYSYELLSYSVHHMILDHITYKATEENFVTVMDYSQTAMLLPDKVRRLSLHFGSATYAATPASTRLSQVRSLFFFGLFNCMPPFKGFKLLRVLNLHLWGDLGNTSFDLTGICELLRLRYLQVTCNVTVKLPVQIEAMKHLETLEINSRVYAIPPGIVRLPSLLHLCLRGGTNLPNGIGCIRSLHTLTHFDRGNNSKFTLSGLAKLTNLRDLHFTYSELMSSEHLKRNLIALASSIGKLCNLKSVTLAPGTARMVVLFDGSSGMSSAPVFLERLELLPPICIFSRLPKWIGQLRKLCIVKVAVKELLTDDIDILAGLPFLKLLSLCVQISPEGRTIFNEGTFLVLRYFEFRCGVLCVDFMVGAMPNLRSLKLAFNTHISDKYNNMLAGIEHLLNLQDITGRIGAATESDRRVAESVFKEAISKHPKCPISSIQWVDPVEKDYRPSEKQHVRQEKGSSGEKHGVLEKAVDTTKDAKRGKTSFARLDKFRTVEAYRNSCSTVFVPQKRVRTRFFCIRMVTKIWQSLTTTKGGADRTENKKQQQKLRTRLNYVQRKNQQQSSYSSDSAGNKAEDPNFFSTTSPPTSQITLTIHQNLASERGEQMVPDAMKQEYLDSNQSNVNFRTKSGEKISAETGVQSQISTQSSPSLLSARHHKEEVYDSTPNLAGQAMETSPNIIWKQDLLAKVKKHEEEIVNLKRHLANYSVKEAQILDDKLDLEKRIAHMRKEFDEKQLDIVDSASKDLSYRQKQIEENMNLAFALREAHARRSTFICSLLPLLSEHNLQPSVLDAHSIVSSLKVLFTHLQTKLTITEDKLKESQNKITPWSVKSSTNTSGHAQSSSHPPANAYVSSFSQAAKDDPLPAIDGLRITGEAFPGRELQASGYSINGTTGCNFEWVRHLEDGSVNFIKGANEPTYLVTADDVDSLLVIEVQPQDDRKRKGEIVKVYANEQRKITCDPETKELIMNTLSTGHVLFEVLLPVFIDLWEPALLAIKRAGYMIKYKGKGGVVITEKFQQYTAINIPYDRPNEFSIQSADGAEYGLKPAESSPSRDSIVLILRLFRMKAVERSKRRKKRMSVQDVVQNFRRKEVVGRERIAG